VHNLRAVDFRLEDEAYDWARRFDDDAKAQLLSDPSSVPRLGGHSDFRSAAPTPDHFIPLLHFAGLAAEAEEPVEVLVEGYSFGSVSMTAYTVGMQSNEAATAASSESQERETAI